MPEAFSDSQIESLLLDRNGKRNGDEIVFRCFFPDNHKNGDQHPSCNYNLLKKVGVCHACKKGFNRNGALVLLGLVQPRRARKVIATYDYRDESGNLLYQVLRYDPKAFSQRRPDGLGGWIKDVKGVRRVLYRLPEILKESDPILLLEGEKDVHAAVEFGLTATCNSGGAGKWAKEYNRLLYGRSILIVPDGDRPGLLHALQVGKSLLKEGVSVRVLRLPGDGKDFYDWKVAGGTRDQFLKLIESKSVDFQHFSGEFPEVKEDLKQSDVDVPWFDGSKFLPAVLASDICSRINLVATPIGEKFKGVYLYLWKNGVYRKDRAGEVESEIREALNHDGTPKRVDDTIDMVSRIRKVSFDLLNRKAKDLINVRNGMLDWKTGEVFQHDQKYLSTIQIDVEYDSKATCPALDVFFSDIFPEDCVPLVEEFIGYLLVPDTSLQKAFIAVGSGGNGKGTFLKILAALLGDENVSTVDLHALENERFTRSLVLGKLANIHHDIGREELESVSVFKTIVSGDPITMEEKHKQGFTARPYARLVFSANEFPRSQDRTNAFFRRLVFVEFPKIFSESKNEVLEYEKRLVSTPGFMSSLLNRAVSGLRRLRASGKFSSSRTSREISETYIRECDSGRDFAAENCVAEEWGWVPRREFYQKYVGWCEDEGIRPMGARGLTASVRKIVGAKEGKREGVRGWTGISWKNGQPPVTTADEVNLFGKRQRSNEF